MIKNMFSDAGAPLVWIHVQQASSTATKKQDTHEKNGGVSFCPADAQRQQRYDVIERHATPFQVPVFYHADHPHDRLYIACLDGTGNEIHDALHATPDLRNVSATIP